MAACLCEHHCPSRIARAATATTTPCERQASMAKHPHISQQPACTQPQSAPVHRRTGAPAHSGT
ncbi:hypothetical protein D0A36_07120 [Xanthomonas campestris]|nr:hypothetical protein D0A41_08650 [Xanthomonas campestris]RFF60143.1 hypothetical protein D0A36_07120 [Xanthomonas campestris]